MITQESSHTLDIDSNDDDNYDDHDDDDDDGGNDDNNIDATHGDDCA